MTDDISIWLAGKTYQLSTLRQLSAADQLAHYARLPAYAQEALQFCHQWVQGTEHFVQHTSGSTGKPKPIRIGREQMQASARMTINALGLKAGEQALVCLSANYIAGKMMLVRAMEVGMHVVIVPPSSQPLRDITTSVDFMAVVPLQLKTILDTGQEKQTHQLNKMRAIIVGGGTVSHELEKSIREKLKCPVYSTYGMTETVSHIALRRLNAAESTDLYQTLPEVEIKTDHRSCLMIRGAVTNQQWLTTNDVVEIHDRSHFRWLGRADHVINSGGIKIQTEALEVKLEKGIKLLGKDRQYFVTGLPDEKLGESVTLVVEGSEPSASVLQLLKQWLAENINVYEQPKQFLFISEFRLTSTGKIMRRESLRKTRSDQNQ